MDMDISVQNEYGKMTLEDYNRNLLKGVYSVFKEADDDLQFVLLTGVTKFSQVSVFSGFNQPNDISMDEHYEALCVLRKMNCILPLMNKSRRWP